MLTVENPKNEESILLKLKLVFLKLYKSEERREISGIKFGLILNSLNLEIENEKEIVQFYNQESDLEAIAREDVVDICPESIILVGILVSKKISLPDYKIFLEKAEKAFLKKGIKILVHF